MVFFDVDGTLSRLHGESTPEVVAMLRALRECGILVAIATGRSPAMLPDFEDVAAAGVPHYLQRMGILPSGYSLMGSGKRRVARWQAAPPLVVRKVPPAAGSTTRALPGMLNGMRLKKRTQMVACALALGMGAGALGGCAATQEAAPVAVTAPATPTPTELTTADVEAFLDGYLPGALNSAKIPGAVVSVVKDGEVVTARGYGYADVEAKTPVTADTLFRVGSVSKIATSIAALQLVEQGKLDLDADIATYVDLPIERQFDQPITLRNLLTHTAGFEERAENVLTFQKDSYDLEADVLHAPPEQVYEPGTTAAYSNYGMAVVGYLVQEISGVPFEEYVQQHIFAPAGMEDSSFAQPLPARLAERMEDGHISAYTRAPGFETLNAPAGSMTSTGADFAKYMIAQMTDGVLLRPETLAMALTPAGGSQELGSNNTEVGLGYFLDDFGGMLAAGHGGDTPSFHSEFALFPEEKTGIFISMNSAGEQSSFLPLRHGLINAFVHRYFETTPDAAVPAAESRQRAEQIAGTYLSSRSFKSTFLTFLHSMPGGLTTVSAGEDGSLTLVEGGLVSRFEEVEPWVWRQAGTNLTLRADTSGEQPRFAIMGESVYSPAPLKYRVSYPLSLMALLASIMVLILWPVGAIRRAWSRRRGDEVSAPLSWSARLARIGALAGVVAGIAWYVMSSMVMIPGIPPALPPVAAVLQWVGVVAILPAGVALVQAIRHKLGVARTLVAGVLLLALLGIGLWAGWNNMLNFDFTT